MLPRRRRQVKDRVLISIAKRIQPMGGVTPAVRLAVFDREDGAP